jgi:hypothetical protein
VETARVALEPEQLEGWTQSYPVRIIVGEGVTLAGTLGHFKGFADLWQADRLWDAIVAAKGRPTFMIGRAEDPDYEAHLKEGKYFVLDDVALDRYKRDPRVTFIPRQPDRQRDDACDHADPGDGPSGAGGGGDDESVAGAEGPVALSVEADAELLVNTR